MQAHKMQVSSTTNTSVLLSPCPTPIVIYIHVLLCAVRVRAFGETTDHRYVPSYGAVQLTRICTSSTAAVAETAWDLFSSTSAFARVTAAESVTRRASALPTEALRSSSARRAVARDPPRPPALPTGYSWRHMAAAAIIASAVRRGKRE